MGVCVYTRASEAVYIRKALSLVSSVSHWEVGVRGCFVLTHQTKQFLPMDILVLETMKDAVKCDT